MRSFKKAIILHYSKNTGFLKIFVLFSGKPLFSLLLCWLLLAGCTKTQKLEMVTEQQRLVETHCGSCHLAVEPSMLDKQTWKEHVLPAMAKKLGLGVWRGPSYYSKKESAISVQDWQKIVAFYDSLAPAKLVEQRPAKPLQSWAGFSLKKPLANLSGVATTTLVRYDPYKKLLYTSDAATSRLFQWQNNLTDYKITALPSPATHMNLAKDQDPVLTLIGQMKAVDLAAGSVQQLTSQPQSGLKEVAKGFVRPIETLRADFNKDGLEDYLVSSFGHETGGLYLLLQSEKKTFIRSAVREVPGATQSIIRDFNGDGWLDIMSLFAHGDEGIWLFLNDKKGGFTQRNILRFPPVFGSSSFDYVDIDKDGVSEIIYTSGDNSDYSKVLKPYHGLYIYSDRGDFKFEKSYFYPVNGSTKALAADFDKDGLTDIALISFFADLKNNPWETFLYFKQKKPDNHKLSFTPFAIPINEYGRWICMDVADYDSDGDQDIILGNYAQGFLNQLPFRPDFNKQIPFVILVNGAGK
ncbi:VCBS repeat-containing protein [Dyadobacter sp. CY356]|uniref:FG-GAP repeat domain-containing protein n=1 Tax=Dyadobacter sp. CY356 TaxID=2906442 RepID=UPI001F48C130|nr:VCBS repeat-containing protein [Dyadobacter sp. CY356]MCF0059105.1 FG-GAP-like repeat-containing protein [Dyadobacter sp. CY356]